MADDSGDKTELPTERRRTEVREKGNVPRSIDLNTAASVLAAAAVLNFMGAELVESLTAILRSSLGARAWTQLDASMLTLHFWRLGELLVRGVLPLLAVMMAVGICINFAQVGFMITPQALAPNFSRINPWEGIRRIASAQGLVKLAGSLLKLIILTAIVVAYVNLQLPAFLHAVGLAPPQLCRQIGESLVTLSFQMALALALLAVLDYGFQLWKFEQDLKMSKQELREEMRHMEGDPQIRARRRDAHRKLSSVRELQQVKEADVVVTNPTEFAVAIRYDAAKMAAPIVVAKGRDALAERIRTIAAEHGVPIVEKKPLARALYRDVKVGQAVPVELYGAVAEILAYVYRLTGKHRKRSA